MLFEQRLNKIDLSPNERIVANYIIEHKDQLQDLTTRKIARETFTTASTVIRLSHKMGYHGFSELKQDYFQEIHYINHHFQEIDPNIPFNKKTSVMNIAGITSSLMKETADDTLTLLDHDLLMGAVQLLSRSNTIYVCGIENNLPLIELFKYKMVRINKQVISEQHFGNQMYTALQGNSKDCALIISYSGQTNNMIRIAKQLHKAKIPIIALTSIGDNRLKNYATYTLHISTREKLHSKIANFSTEYSIMLLLNILYSAVFAQDYDKNLQNKIERSKMFEISRFSTTDIISED